jgi:hypothetical protein
MIRYFGKPATNCPPLLGVDTKETGLPSLPCSRCLIIFIRKVLSVINEGVRKLFVYRGERYCKLIIVTNNKNTSKRVGGQRNIRLPSIKKPLQKKNNQQW